MARCIKSGKRPHDIPADVYAIYKKEFKGMEDWLGTGTLATKDREYLPFEEAKKIVHSFGFRSEKEWRKWCKSGEKPKSIPAYPRDIYIKKNGED
jgi:hypothetical protein